MARSSPENGSSARVIAWAVQTIVVAPPAMMLVASAHSRASDTPHYATLVGYSLVTVLFGHFTDRDTTRPSTPPATRRRGSDRRHRLKHDGEAAMKRALFVINLGLRFVLELCVFAAWAVWGAQLGRGIVARVGLGFGAAILVIVVWGLFVAPKARVPLPLTAWLLLQFAIFAVAVSGLSAAGQPLLALVLALLLAVNSAALFLSGDHRRAQGRRDEGHDE